MKGLQVSMPVSRLEGRSVSRRSKKQKKFNKCFGVIPARICGGGAPTAGGGRRISPPGGGTPGGGPRRASDDINGGLPYGAEPVGGRDPR